MSHLSKDGNYVPAPLETADVTLPPELADLLEKLAAHVHDVWAEQRMKEGWRYGPNRDDSLKTHPGLVPYADLSESEKDYDRNTAAETLRAIVLLGYSVRHSGHDTD